MSTIDDIKIMMLIKILSLSDQIQWIPFSQIHVKFGKLLYDIKL